MKDKYKVYIDYILIACLVFSAIMSIITIYGFISSSHFHFYFGNIDYIIYKDAYKRYTNDRPFYRDGFIYLPCFFMLFQFICQYDTYMLFLVICYAGTIPFLLRLDMNFLAKMSFLFTVLVDMYSLNISVFILLIVAILLNIRKEHPIIPIILAFLCFKPNVIIIVAFFFILTENKKQFVIIFALSLCVFNVELILRPELFFDLIDYYLNGFDDKNRILWSGTANTLVCYYTIKEKLLTIKAEK